MKPNNKILDELDLKCLNEMPLILEVLSSTGNKITRIISPFYSEMNELIKSILKPNWHVGKRSYECHIFPMTSQESGKISIESLEPVIKIESAINIIKIVKGKEIDSIYVKYGYYCYFDEDETTNAFYFEIINENISDKSGGVVNGLKFYKQIQSKLPDYKIEIHHPENGHDYEYIVLWGQDFSVEKIHEGYNKFKQSILIPFVKTLP